MSGFLRQASRRLFLLIVSALLLTASLQIFSADSKAEIPHENYDLISSDLDVVIRLLNSSIRASEQAFMNMYNESMDEVDQDLKVVDGILEPAGRLLDRIVDLAESYKNLSTLLPPFVSLSEQELRFASMEREFLDLRSLLSSYGDIQNLTGENLTGALREVARGRTLMEGMNSTIDQLLLHASDINDLTLNVSHPFLPNDMIPLIEKLRDLLMLFELEFDDIIHNRIAWNETLPFLILWVKDTNLYLGETLIGGGYLYFNGSFQIGRSIEIKIDDNISIFSTTTSGGEYSFSFEIPINVSWLGSHFVQSFTDTGWENLSSEKITFFISLVPTKLVISVNKTLLSLEDDLEIKVSLRDVYGKALASDNCTMTRDTLTSNFSTDFNGAFSFSWQKSEIGLGIHTISAEFSGFLPYAPSSSNFVSITVNIPTKIDLTLFEDRYIRGFYVVGNGTLYANESEPLANQTITLIIDGNQTINLTTRGDGSFAFSIETENMTVGTHSLVAAFLYRDSMWRYSQAEVSFNMIVQQRILPYPFFPYIPGWGGVGGIGDLINLFFGQYAYLTWILMLIVLATIIRSWQLKKKREALAKAASSELFKPTTEPAIFAESGQKIGTGLETGPPENPNGRIVWYYNSLLRNLTGKRKVSIIDSMTHWEVARLLRALGYPFGDVDKITILFERAFYSGSSLSESDAQNMMSSVEKIESIGQEGSSSAV